MIKASLVFNAVYLLSLMIMYADVAFPLKIPPFTYKAPPGHAHDLKGRIVKAPLMGRSSYGLVIDVFDSADESLKKELKEIRSVHCRIASETDIRLLKWLSSYYLAPLGIALKSGFFEEAVKCCNEPQKLSGELKNHGFTGSFPDAPPALREKNASFICDSIGKEEYKAFLSHAPSASAESSFLLDVLGGAYQYINGAVILAPEIRQAEKTGLLLKEIFGDRLCVLHSKISRAKMRESVRKIITGESDIVVGTRIAALAPLKKVCFIAVTGEHSASYKGEEGLRYNARDVAVMRSFIGKSCVLLSSVSPSLESVYNSSVGKYIGISGCRKTFCGGKDDKTGRHVQLPGPAKISGASCRPKIKIVGPGSLKHDGLAISKELLREAKKILSKDERLLFIVNRKGYSLVKCFDCGQIVKCGKCRVPFVFYKKEGVLKCRYCSSRANIPDTCEYCSGVNLKTVGAGTERIKEEAEELLNEKALLMEKGRDAKVVNCGEGKTASCIPLLDPDVVPFIIGTAYAARRTGSELFHAAAFLNIDMLLSQPDFRAYERVFQEVVQVSQIVKPQGFVYLQTRMSEEKVFRFIKNYDFDGFYRHEMSQRKAFNNPPFAKMAILNILAKKIPERLLDDMRRMITAPVENGVEIFGPADTVSPAKSYKYCIQLLIKSRSSSALHARAKALIDELEKIKGVKVNADVDPLSI